MTTKSLLDRAAEFEKATPPGEWCDDGDMIGTCAKINGNVVCVAPDDRLGGSLALWPTNKRAIIEARSLVPELAAELKRDISTAPRDGTEIQAWDPSHGVRQLVWNYSGLEQAHGWLLVGEGLGCYEPTHWRELPKGPRTSREIEHGR